MSEIDVASLPVTKATKPKTRPRRRPRYEEKLPEVVKMVKATYASTGSMNKTGKALGISHETVKQILTRNPDDFAAAQKILASTAATYAAAALDRAHATVDKLSGLPAIIAAKTAGQMQLEQLGKLGATVNVQVNIAQALTENMRALATLSTRTPSNQAVQTKPAQAQDQPASQPSPAAQPAKPA